MAENKKYTVRFEPAGAEITVDPACYPYGRAGLPGSLLDIALNGGVQIDHACGGVGVCGTCHVIVTAGMDHLSPADDEVDVLEQVPGTSLNSRLACRAIVGGNVTVTIPGWNRNAVSEGGGH